MTETLIALVLCHVSLSLSITAADCAQPAIPPRRLLGQQFMPADVADGPSDAPSLAAGIDHMISAGRSLFQSVVETTAELPETDVQLLVALGDSYTDSGRKWTRTNYTVPAPEWFWRGRYSNGPVWPGERPVASPHCPCNQIVITDLGAMHWHSARDTASG